MELCVVLVLESVKVNILKRSILFAHLHSHLVAVYYDRRLEFEAPYD